MNYRSTRGTANQTLTAPAAILQGLSPDGGLYVPVDFPQPDIDLNQLSQLSYQDLAAKILSWFFDDFSEDQIRDAVAKAYGSQWDDSAIAPLSALHDGSYYLELFHGPTLAFKDIALQVLPQLMVKSIKTEGIDKDIVILTATSGDTGTASMRGFSNQDGTQVIVFYPEGGVSPVQLTQMLGQRGNNLQALAIKGNFDDAQTQVKHIFNDQDFVAKLNKGGFQFSSANSMNIGRLVPQIVYYFYSYGRLLEDGKIQAGDKVNFTVPTGNFGDILAGYYAKKLGLPVNKLICASNENKVLTDFFNSGKYDRQRPFHLTNAPAMDILVSSNLERLLFDLYGEDNTAIQDLMNQLDNEGHYTVSPEVKAKLDAEFASGWADQDQVKAQIKHIYDQDGYVIDPHTAVASFVAANYQKDSGDKTPNIIVSTASPYKFPETVYQSVTGKQAGQQGLPAIKQLQAEIGGQLTAGVQALFNQEPRKEQVIKPGQMEDQIADILDL